MWALIFLTFESLLQIASLKRSAEYRVNRERHANSIRKSGTTSLTSSVINNWREYNWILFFCISKSFFTSGNTEHRLGWMDSQHSDESRTAGLHWTGITHDKSLSNLHLLNRLETVQIGLVLLTMLSTSTDLNLGFIGIGAIFHVFSWCRTDWYREKLAVFFEDAFCWNSSRNSSESALMWRITSVPCVLFCCCLSSNSVEPSHSQRAVGYAIFEWFWNHFNFIGHHKSRRVKAQPEFSDDVFASVLSLNFSTNSATENAIWLMYFLSSAVILIGPCRSRWWFFLVERYFNRQITKFARESPRDASFLTFGLHRPHCSPVP